MGMVEKIELIKATNNLCNFWGVEPNTLFFGAILNRPTKTKEWNKIAKDVKKFYEAGIEERAVMIGLKLTKNI